MNSSIWRKIPLLFLAILVILMGLSIYPFFVSEKPEDRTSAEQSLISKTPPLAQLLNMPLHFEKNEGQMDPHFHYLTRSPGQVSYFSPQEVTLCLQSVNQKEVPSILKMQFVESNSHSIIEGIDKQDCTSNYFIGNDSSKWHTAIANYAKIIYQDLYPGIDALFYGNGKQLEYDFIVAPWINPDCLRIRLEGAQELTISEEGDLQIIVNGEGLFQMKKPSVYQVIEGKKIDVAGEFALLAAHEVGFTLKQYDRSHELVIDPILAYSTYLGGNNSDSGRSVAIDSNGNIYIAGQTVSSNFPTTSSAFQTIIGGGAAVSNAFVTKLNATGSSLFYSTYLGGTTSGSDGFALAINESGHAYVAGSTSATDFPTTAGAFQTSRSGVGTNGFITQLDALGSALVYSTYLGVANSSCSGIALDESGNAYVTGSVTNTGFPTTAGAFQTAKASGVGAASAFVSQLNPVGSALIYSTYLGGSGGGAAGDSGSGIALDRDGNAYVVGSATATGFPTTSGAFQTSKSGTGSNGFITKLNSSGSALVYSTYLAGSGATNQILGIALDSDRNAYVTGTTTSTNFPTTSGAFQTSKLGVAATVNGFITQLNASGSALLYSTYLGGSSNTSCRSIALNAFKEAYIIGGTSATNYPVTANAFQPSLLGTNDAFITKMNSTGSALIYSTYLGGSGGANDGFSVCLDSNGNAYLTGSTNSTTFPVTAGSFQTNLGGSGDAFAAKFNIGTPAVTEVNPTVGPPAGGTIVTITGVNFSNATAIYFGEDAAAAFVIDSDTQITAVSPPHAVGTVDITVEGIGVSPISLDDQFTYETATTTTSLSVSPNPAKVGQTVTLTASLSPSSATGSVSFFNGTSLLGAVSLTSGTAEFAVDSLPAGTYTLTALYSGDGTFNESTSSAERLTIELDASTTQLAIEPNRAKIGRAITMTATVSPSAATGTVTFFDGKKLLRVVTVADGKATFTRDSLAPGKHFIIASYSGDHAYIGSVSQIETLRIEPVSQKKSQ